MPVLYDKNQPNNNITSESIQRPRNINRLNDTAGEAGNIDKLDKLITNDARPLFKATTVFPFTLFPDDVIVDREKVSIISRAFFASARIQSILIANISDVYIDTSIWFGTLKIVDKFFVQNVVTINYLKKKEVTRIRKIIQGLVVVQRKNVDVSKIEDQELIPRLEEIGSAY